MLPWSVAAESGGARLTRGGRLLLVTLTVWALTMIVPGLHRVFDSLDSFGLSVDNDGIVADVVHPFRSAAESPASAAGIAPGDRIDLRAMRCSPPDTPQCASLVAILGGLGGMQAVLPNRQITLALRRRSDGSAETVKLRSAPAPLSSAERVVLFADTLVGTVVILIAFWLVRTRPSWMTWGLFLYVIWINPGQTFTYYALLQRWPVAVLAQEFFEGLAQGAAFAGLMIFALRFPNDQTEPRWRKVEWTVPLIAAAMTVLTLLSFSNTFGFPTERLTEASFLAGYAIDAAALLILLVRRRGLPPQEEQRMRWVIWGCAIGVPTYIFAELCQSSDLIRHLLGVTPPQVLIGLLYLPNGVFAYLASQAVWQRRVVSVSIPLRRGTILVGLSLAVAVPIFQLHEKFSAVQESFRLPAWIWLLLIAPVFLLLLHRLHEFAVEMVDRVFNRRYHSTREQLEAASDALKRAETLAEIDLLLVQSAVRALHLSSGAIFRADGDVFRRRQDTDGWNDSMKKELRAEADAIVLHSLKLAAPVRLSLGAWDSAAAPVGLEAPCLAVPVRSGVPGVAGVALFGPHLRGNDLDADEREMLDRLVAQAATAYERVVTSLLLREVKQLKAQLALLQGGNRPGTENS